MVKSSTTRICKALLLIEKAQETQIDIKKNFENFGKTMLLCHQQASTVPHQYMFQNICNKYLA